MQNYTINEIKDVHSQIEIYYDRYFLRCWVKDKNKRYYLCWFSGIKNKKVAVASLEIIQI